VFILRWNVSGDFAIDPPGKADLDLLWMSSRGLLHRVIEFVAGEVEDPQLAAALRTFVAGGYSFVSLGRYSEEQATQIMAVIREKLPVAAAEWFPGDDVARGVVAELVEMVEEAEAAPDAD
jgi:hypothetical protein